MYCFCGLCRSVHCLCVNVYYVLYYCHQVSTQLQLNISYYIMGPKSYYHVSERSPLIATLNQINSGHPIPSYLFQIHLNIIFPSTTPSSKRSLHVSQPNSSDIYLSPPPSRHLFGRPNYIWWLRSNHTGSHYDILSSLIILSPSTRTYTTLNGGGVHNDGCWVTVPNVSGGGD
jgi:hypothetical protein